ncbi:hypothetical protein ABEB36_003766 [Hypothenemus hampei]|uniref:Cardioactive peptide n=1 Tax=Hypothenemus hampei TaxID=57062 RepID=A0ABD1F122_HYPHA
MTALAVLFIALYSTAMTVIMGSEGLFLPKKLSPYINTREKIIFEPKKRPFCNAFTGCGRKRSNLPALSSDGQEVDNSIDSLLELSAEPAVEDLSRQIMSEAKLWEAIQEANLELNRQRQGQPVNKQNKNDETSSDSDRGAIATCALPPCYIT